MIEDIKDKRIYVIIKFFDGAIQLYWNKGKNKLGLILKDKPYDSYFTIENFKKNRFGKRILDDEYIDYERIDPKTGRKLGK
jgi:hypothetical protein